MLAQRAFDLNANRNFGVPMPLGPRRRSAAGVDEGSPRGVQGVSGPRVRC